MVSKKKAKTRYQSKREKHIWSGLISLYPEKAINISAMHNVFRRKINYPSEIIDAVFDSPYDHQKPLTDCLTHLLVNGNHKDWIKYFSGLFAQYPRCVFFVREYSKKATGKVFIAAEKLKQILTNLLLLSPKQVK